MLEVIKDMHFATHCFCSNDIVALRHIASSVNLTCMVYLHLYLNPFILNVRSSNTCDVFCIILVIPGIL